MINTNKISIEVENYKHFKYLKIEFKKDLNVIIGENNSVKTSIFHAFAGVFGIPFGRDLRFCFSSKCIKCREKLYWRAEFFPNEIYSLNDLSTKSYKVISRKGNYEEVLTTEDESYIFQD